MANQASTQAMATTKMSLTTFVILSVLGLVVQYLIIFGGLAALFFAIDGFKIASTLILSLLIVLIYAVVTIILFGIGFFGFRKNPDNTLYRSLVVFFAPALLSILGVIASYFVLKGRRAL